MERNDRISLSKYRLEQSEQCLGSAQVLLEYGDYKGAANRAYYAIYHAIRSVIALDGKEFVKHSGNNSYFRMQYIKTGILDSELSDIISKAFSIRNGCDYNDFYIVSVEETKKQLENAERFYNAVKEYLISQRYNE